MAAAAPYTNAVRPTRIGLHIRARRSSQAGQRARAFTLAETMVIAAILSTVLLCAMALIPSFKTSGIRASLELQAGARAQSALEGARAVSFDDLVTSPPVTSQAEGVTFSETRTVTDLPSGSAKTVRVTVDWTWKDKPYQVFREAVVCRIPRG